MGDDHPVERGRVAGVGDVGLDVERHVENARDGVAHIERRHERQNQRASRTDSPGGEGLPEIGFGAVEVEPVGRRVEESGDAERGVDEEARGLVAGPLPLRPEETAECAGGKLQIDAEVVEFLDHRPRQNRGVDPPDRIDEVVHDEVGAGEHRPVEAFDRIGAAEGVFQLRRGPDSFVGGRGTLFRFLRLFRCFRCFRFRSGFRFLLLFGRLRPDRYHLFLRFRRSGCFRLSGAASDSGKKGKKKGRQQQQQTLSLHHSIIPSDVAMPRNITAFRRKYNPEERLFEKAAPEFALRSRRFQ